MQQPLPSASPHQTERRASPVLQGRLLQWARALWLLITTTTVAAFVFTLPIGYQFYITPSDSQCGPAARFTSAELAGMVATGLSPHTFALWLLGLEVLFVLVFILVGVLLFAKRAEDPTAYLASRSSNCLLSSSVFCLLPRLPCFRGQIWLCLGSPQDRAHGLHQRGAPWIHPGGNASMRRRSLRRWHWRAKLATVLALALGSLLTIPAVPTPERCARWPAVAGTFLQPWLAANWSPAQWTQEFRYMHAACIDELVLQWTADSHAGTAVYPAMVVGLRQDSPRDVVELALATADQQGQAVYLGLQESRDWWTHYADDPEWLASQARLSRALAHDLWTRYRHHPAWVGWYLPFEVDNWHFLTPASWEQLAGFYTAVGQELRRLAPDKPILVSPFFNPTGGLMAGEWARMWAYVSAHSPLDIVALQDGRGTGHSAPADLQKWFAATQAGLARGRPSTRLWSTAEVFTPAAEPRAIGQVVADMVAVRPYVSRYLAFSFNHYMSPQQGATASYGQYLDYLMPKAASGP